MQESYVKEEYVNRVGLKTMVMGLREISAEEQASRLAVLLVQADEVNDDGTFSIESDECAICTSCKEWSGIVRHYDAEGYKEEEVSNCCSASVYEF